MRRLRIASQIIFFIIFLILFVFTKSDAADSTITDVSPVFYIDPLISITKLFADHSLSILFLLSLLTIILTIFTGRSFCGWVCPLGTLNDIAGRLRKKGKELLRIRYLEFKYIILVFLLILSLTGINLSGFFDPLSLTIRSFTIFFYPLYNLIIHNTYEFFMRVFYNSDILPSIYSSLKRYLIENQSLYFYQSLLIGSIFFAILFLNFISRRFWCRYICPLGALLGIISRYAFIKREERACTECGICETRCHGGAMVIENDRENRSECILCMNCQSLCPEDSISFRFQSRLNYGGVDLDKRRMIISAGSSLLFYPLFKSSLSSSSSFHSPVLIRPPGSVREDIFLKRCIRCGACMKVCITNGLQPTLLEAGLEGMWTPHLIFRIGHCEYNCNLCSQVCPTDAIRGITLSEKKSIKIGTAHINRDRCIAYRDAKGCLVCEEVCPVPEKAIKIENIQVQIDNVMRPVKVPRVVSALCVGCGLCERNCPVVDSPAIYVTSIGESRSEENQELLE